MQKKSELVSSSIIAMAFVLLVGFVFVKSISVPLNLAKSYIEGSKLTQISQDYERQFNSSFPKKNLFVDINGLCHRIFLQREMNGVYLLENGHATVPAEEWPDEGIQANAYSTVKFADWLKANGINYLYVQIPYKNEPGNSMLPKNVTCYSNSIADRFLSILKENGIPHLDLRECIKEDCADFYSLFMKTDHHWNPYGGFYGFTKICEYMQNNFGEVIDPKVVNLDNYVQETIAKKTLDFYGRKTGSLFLTPQEYTLIYPKFQTKQSCNIVHRDVVRQGTFYDAIFDMSYIESEKTVDALYSTYIGGDFPLVIHKSETAQNPGMVMIFIDSFGTMIESFMSTAYKDVIAIDLRWVLRNGWDETARDYIERFKPQTVIVAFNPNQIGNAESEQFYYGIE